MFNLKESVIDIPRRHYAKGIFDNADTENPKLKSSVLEIINTQLKEFEKIAPIQKYSLVGSIITKQYRDDADLDVNVLFDVPYEKRDEMRKMIAKSLKDINGKIIPGTKHPINYYVITDPNVKETNDKMADGVFDIKNNTFIRRAKEFKFDPKRYAADFEKKVKEIDVVQGELKRDIIDYKELKELDSNDVINLQDLVNEKINEIEDGVKHLVDMGNTALKDRADAFATDMTPDEIRDFGKKNQLPKNVVYKMLEKYHYLKFYKELKHILDDGVVSDTEIQSIQTENLDKSIAFAFGRFNPPTIGHEKLIQKVASLPTNDYKIYLSKSFDDRSNPLRANEKLFFMKKMFPRYSSNILINQSNMVLEIATSLYNKGYKSITMVAGSDRIREFESLLKKYNDVKSRHGYYNFKDIKVVSAGERDPDEEGVGGMSASKLRNYAASGDFKSFERGIPDTLKRKDKHDLFNAVRKGMDLESSAYDAYAGYENKPIASLEQFEQQQVRDLYIREMIFNLNEYVHNVHLDVKGKVVRRGTNYIVIEDNNNNLHKSWIWDCVPISSDREVEMREIDLNVDYGFTAVTSVTEDKTPQDKDVGKVPGTQPKKYYKDLPKKTKEKRAAFFKSQEYEKGKVDYKPAPGDEQGKTQPSKHTIKFKKMFGELKVNLKDACWKGYKQIGMKKKGDRMVPNCVPEEIKSETTKKEAYDQGHDYAQHTAKTTPGEPQYEPNYKGTTYKPSNPVDNNKRITVEDIENWAGAKETIDKYRERYGENYQSRIDEVKKKMMSFKDYVKF